MCLALVVLCAALMGWRAHRTFRPMYRSEAVFSVNLSFVGGTDLSGYSQYYNKSAAQQVADTFPYLLTSDRMQELLLQRLGVTYLNGVISSSAIKDTSFFVLTVESPSPQDAYDILWRRHRRVSPGEPPGPGRNAAGGEPGALPARHAV